MGKSREDILREKWDIVKKAYGNPRMPYPKIVSDEKDEIKTSKIDLMSKEIHLHKSFLDKLELAGMDMGDAIEGILDHEVGHHRYCPWDLVTRLKMYKEVRKVVEDENSRWHMINMFEDVALNTNSLSGNKDSKIPDLYKTFFSKDSPEERVMLGLYERLWNRDMGKPITEEAEKSIVDELEMIPYLESDLWDISSRKFAEILKPLVKTQESFTLACGSRGIGDFSDEEKIKALKTLVGEMDPKEMKDLIKDLGKNIDGAIHKYLGASDYNSGLDGMPNDADIMRYMMLAERNPIDVWERPEQKTGKESSSEHGDWEISDPISDFDPFTSLGQTAPGISKKWKRGGGYGETEGKDLPDLLIMIDSSGSMTNPSKEMSYAVLGAGIAADAYLRKGKNVAVFNFSNKEQIKMIDYTNIRRDVYAGLLTYFNGGTTLNVDLLDRMLDGKKDAVFITDMDLTNPDEASDYINNSKDRFSVVEIASRLSFPWMSSIPNIPNKLREGLDKKIPLYFVSDQKDIPKILQEQVKKYLFE